MISFLKLIRFPNLLIIALTQCAMRWGVIYPIVSNADKQLSILYPDIIQPGAIFMQLSNLKFFLVVLATVLIAAAGYIINDYFDVKSDRINKPGEVVIDIKINRRFAILWHTILNVIAIVIATFIGYQIGVWKIGIFYFLCAGALWYYSTTLKKQLLTGNLLIAVFTALVPLTVAAFELPLFLRNYHSIIVDAGLFNPKYIFYFICGFSLFAFFTTLIREIIKDMEDVEGDKECGCNTLPIYLGINKTKGIVIALILITMAILGYTQSFMDAVSIYYLLFAVQIPSLVLILLIIRAQNPKDFHAASIFNKVIMLLGILYTAIIYYNFI